LDQKKKGFAIAPVVGDKAKTVYFDGMPWIDQISTLMRRGHQSIEFVQEPKMGGYVGTNAAFLPVPDLKRIREDADVQDLGALKAKRTPHRLHLDSSRGYSAGNVPTKPNHMIPAVYITVPPLKQ
jgi:hypothetical protein